MLLRFASERQGKPPTKLRVEELDAALVGDFLTHIETARRNSARSRNTRLAAIRSFFRIAESPTGLEENPESRSTRALT